LPNISIFDQKFDFWPKFRFLTKISIFDETFDFWPKFRFLTKISIFDQNFDFWPKFRFFTKRSIFDQNFDFWPKFRFLTKISIFDQKFDFWRKVRFVTKIWIFDQNFDFWPTFVFFVDQFFYFWRKFRFLTKITIFDRISKVQISDLLFSTLLLVQCSESEQADLLHVFGESISSLFPQSEEATGIRLGNFSQTLLDFVIESKRGFKVASDASLSTPFGASVRVVKIISV